MDHHLYIFAEFEPLMLHAKFQDHRTSCSRVEDFFFICGRGGHLGQMTWIIYINYVSPFPGRLHMKFGFVWSMSSFREQGLGGNIHVNSPGIGEDNPLG